LKATKFEYITVSNLSLMT